MRQSPKEHFLVFLLDVKHRLVGVHVASIGGLDVTTVVPRDIFSVALLASAATIVVAHNHPSGDPTPSESDRLVTDRLKSCGTILGIEVLDHVILGRDRFYSFAESAFFPTN